MQQIYPPWTNTAWGRHTPPRSHFSRCPESSPAPRRASWMHGMDTAPWSWTKNLATSPLSSRRLVDTGIGELHRASLGPGHLHQEGGWDHQGGGEAVQSCGWCSYWCTTVRRQHRGELLPHLRQPKVMWRQWDHLQLELVSVLPVGGRVRRVQGHGGWCEAKQPDPGQYPELPRANNPQGSETLVWIDQTSRLELLHANHRSDLAWVKKRAQEHMFWPKMIKDLKSYIDQCKHCQIHMTSHQKEPLIPTEALLVSIPEGRSRIFLRWRATTTLCLWTDTLAGTEHHTLSQVEPCHQSW